MSASTLYHSYSIALPSVQVAVASGRGLLARGIEAVARRLAWSIVERPIVSSADAALAPAQWRAEAALRQQGMRDWLAAQQPAATPGRTGSAADMARVHKALWLELVG